MLTLLCLSILSIFREHPRVTAVQRGAVDVVAFASNIVMAPFDAWDRLLESVRSRNALQDEVLRLQQENRVLKGKAQRLASLLSENARYKALLNSARDIEDELIAAQISSVSPDPARHLVMLLLFELLHAAVVGILMLLWVAVLGGLLAVWLVSNRIAHHFVRVAVHHRR